MKSWSCWQSGIGWSPPRTLAKLAIIPEPLDPLTPSAQVFGFWKLFNNLFFFTAGLGVNDWKHIFSKDLGELRIGVERKWVCFSHMVRDIYHYIRQQSASEPNTWIYDKVLCGKLLSQAAIILRLRYPDLVVWFNYSVHT